MKKTIIFYGDSLLVAPVTEQGARSVDVNLPSGPWFNFWNDKRYQGSQKITVEAPLTQTPVLVRAGAFIPMVDAVQSTKDYNTKNLTLHYYADDSVKSSSSTMYNDDGKDPKSLSRGDFETLNFSATQKQSQLTVELKRQGQFASMPAQRSVSLEVHNWLNDPKQINYDGKAVKRVSSHQQYLKSEQAAWYDKENQRLAIKFSWKKMVTIDIY